MSENSQSKKLVKNALYLYLRMLFLMIITFYTARIVLDKLGFVDYGIQNVVGGLASMFAFFRSALSNATQRYLSIALGVKDLNYARDIFRQHFTIYLCIGILVVIVAEVVGIWLIYNKLVIPPDRLNAAFWVFQFTIASLFITILSVVLNSEIVAHEDFKIYSYIGIFEGVAKLAIAYIISIVSFDRLIVFCFLNTATSYILFAYYYWYCKLKYEECKFNLLWDRKSIKEAFAFINWNVVGTFTYSINDWGMSLLLNLFFGPVVNAARGIALQISHAVTNFSQNIYSSVRPQLIKSYAEKDYSYMNKLFYSSSKYSVLFLWILSLPLILRMDDVLLIWLKEVPDYTSAFSLWILAYSLVNALTEPIWTLILATGKLKRYILIGNSILLSTIPIAYIALKTGYTPVSIFIIAFIIKALHIMVVLKILSNYITLSIADYVREVIIPCSIILSLSGMLSFFSCELCIGGIGGVGGIIIVCFITLLVNSIMIYYFGLNESEKIVCVRYVKEKVKHHGTDER